MKLTRRSLLATTLGFPAIVRGEGTAPLDEAMRGLMDKHGIPGAALGIARAGKIAYAKGFGFADRERGTAATADSKFRLASVSKPITAAAVLRLCEQGKLSLDEAVLPKLELEPLSGEFGDKRWGQITVRQLLNHTGGWDKAVSGDAMFKSPEICAAADCRAPADAKTTVRWMLGRRLDFEPGSRYAYCNFGYCVLGRLIEAVTGQSYGAAVRKLVLAPCGAEGIVLGHSLDAVAGEVAYHQPGNAPSVYPQLGERAPWPYGTFSLEANDANGGWVANVTDMLRFLSSQDEGARKPLLQRESLNAIYNSAAPGSGSDAAYYSLGWMVRPKGQAGRPNLWHIGGLPGTKTIAVRLGDGFDWIALFNSRPGGDPDGFDRFNVEVQNTIHAAAGKITLGLTRVFFKVAARAAHRSMAAVTSLTARTSLCCLLLACAVASRASAAGGLEDQRDYQAARQALSDGLFDVAAVKAGRLVAQDGFDKNESRQLASLWVEALVRAGRGHEALAALKDHEVDNQTFWQGQSLLLTGDFDDAAVALAKAIETVPPVLKPWATLARVHALVGDGREGAARTLIKPVRDDPNPAIARHARLFFNELEVPERPQNVLDRLSRERGAKDAVVQYIRASALLELNDTAKSESVLHDLLSTDTPGMASLVHDAATVLLAQVLAREHATSERALETVIAFLNSFGSIAGARLDTEFWGEAFVLLDQLALSVKPGELLVRTPVIAWAADATMPERQGYAIMFVAAELHRTHRDLEATGLMESLIQSQPQHARIGDALRFAMQLHGIARNDTRVLQLAERWREEFGGGGGRSVVDFLVGLIHFMRGDHSDALHSFVLAADGEADHSRRRRALYNAAVCAIKTGQKTMLQSLMAQLSKASAEDAATKKPGSPPLHDTDADLALDKALQLAAKIDPRAEKELLDFISHRASSPRVAEAQIALAEFRLLDVPPRVKDAAEALANATRIATDAGLRERIAHVQIWLHEAQLDQNGVVTAAQSYLKEWPESDRADEVHMKLAEALYRQEKYALARTEFERLSTMYPTSEYADAALYFAGMSAMALSTAEGLNAAISTWDDLIQRGGPLAFAARQQQAIATLRQGNREKALKIYDTLLSTPDAKGEQRLSLQIEKAQLLIDLGRKEPKQREAAVALLREMLASERLSYTWSARCGVMLATTLRDLGRNSEALEACYDVINVGTNVISGPQNPTEYLWFYRAGFTAVDLLETAQQWEPAARIAERLAQTSGDRAKDAAERASKIRLKHFLWDGEK